MNEWQITMVILILQSLTAFVTIAKFSNTLKKDKYNGDSKHDTEHANFKTFIQETNTRLDKLEEHYSRLSNQQYTGMAELKSFVEERFNNTRDIIEKIYHILIK